MLWGDVELKKNSVGKEYLEFTEKSTKTRSGVKTGDCRKVLPKAFAVPEDENCPIKIYKAYRDHRPLDMRDPDSRFYLRPLNRPVTPIWYSKQCVGKNKMGVIMKTMAEKCDLQGRKVNHSSCKTFGTTLLNGGRPLTEVADFGGWKSIESIKSYVTPSIKEQEKASDTISSPLIPTEPSSTTSENSSTTTNSTVDVVAVNTQLQYVNHNDGPIAASSNSSGASLNITEQSIINNLNMPTFDMSRINGILYGTNISSGTFNFKINSKI